jgi:urease accessory protein
MGGGNRSVHVATQSDIFAANRAMGRVSLAVAAARGATARTRVDEAGSLRVRFLRRTSDDLEAVLVNTAGGIAGGDRFELDVAVGEGARLVVSTAAAEKVYRALGPQATIDVKLKIDAGGSLLWLPQETILFDQAQLRRSIKVDVIGDAKLVLAEALVFGRSAKGETIQHGGLMDRWRIRRDGKLAFAETLRLDGAIAAKLGEKAVADGGAAVASLLTTPGDEAMVEKIRALDGRFRSEVAASAWNGLAVARIVAKDGAALRHDLALTLTALGVALPRPWLN